MKTNLNLSRAICRVVVAVWLSWACLIAAEPARTVIIVRHAERAGGNDPSVSITEAGRCRAAVLAGMLSGAKVRTIYTTELARTQQTAAPLALRLSIKPEVVPAKDIDALVAKLRARTEEGAVLVVGHSNTLPAIVERLTGETEPAIGESEYDRMFVLTLIGPNQAGVVVLRYPGCPESSAAATKPDSPEEKIAKRYIEGICSSCHSAGLIRSTQATKQEWLDIVTRMNGLDAGVSQRDVDVLVDYLASTYGRK